MASEKLVRREYKVKLTDGRILFCKAHIFNDVYDACEELGVNRREISKIEPTKLAITDPPKIPATRYRKARAFMDTNLFFGKCDNSTSFTDLD